MSLEAERRALSGLNLAAEVKLADADTLTLTTAGRQLRFRLPADSGERSWDALLDFHHALPGRARGDQREMLLTKIVQDAAPSVTQHESDGLREALATRPGVLPAEDENQRQVLASVLSEQYWVKTGTPARQRLFMFPFQAAVPVNYRPRGRFAYKMFRSDILLFLCWDSQTGDIDPEPVRALCDLLNSRDDLTLLDELLIDSALNFAGSGAPDRVDYQELLQGGQAKKVRDALADGAFSQSALDRFREDLQAALTMPLARHDLVTSAILTLSLHLGLYYYEVAARLGQGLDALMAVAGGRDAVPVSGIASSLRFRLGTAGDRPVRQSDGCAQAWRELDDGYLIRLSPNIITANLLHQVWRELDSSAPRRPDPAALAQAMSSDAQLTELVDAAARALAVLYASRTMGADGRMLDEAGQLDPGVHALRTVVLTHRRKTLEHPSRKVVNQLIRRPFGGSLISNRGAVRFFELDEEFLFLLVRFVLQRAAEEELPFSDFLSGLAAYGLVPQDGAEEDELAAALERLGMLHRYSDAGEANYVRQPL